MHAPHHALDNALCGAMLTGLLGFAGASLAQEEAIADYNRYLDNRASKTVTYPEPDAAQAAVIRDLELRIDCLELTQMPCAGRGLARERVPSNTDAAPAAGAAPGAAGTQ